MRYVIGHVLVVGLCWFCGEFHLNQSCGIQEFIQFFSQYFPTLSDAGLC